jgi:hypothetical protein
MNQSHYKRSSKFLALLGIVLFGMALLFGAHENKPKPQILYRKAAGDPILSLPNKDLETPLTTLQARDDYLKPTLASVNDEMRLVAEIEDYLFRLSNMRTRHSENEEMAVVIQMAIARSALVRTHLAKRLAQAFKNQDTLVLFELEAAFTTTKETFDAVLPIYEDEIKNKGPLDFHAIQILASSQASLTDAQKLFYLDRAIDQLNSYSDLDHYTGPLQYLIDAATDADYSISPIQRNAAIIAVRNRMETARTESSQYVTATALFNLSSPQNARALAQDLLSRPANLAYVHATLGAIASERVAYDQDLILTAARMFQSGAFQGEYAAHVLDLLDTLQKPLEPLAQNRQR